MAETTAKSEPDKVENEFSYPWSCSDLVLLVEGRQLHASKMVLGMVSPVLLTMLNQASSHNTAQEVALPQKKYADVVEFLRCVHPHISKDVTEEWLEVLLSLAEEFQCQVLTQKCRTFLENQLERCRWRGQNVKDDVSGEGVLRWLRLASKFLQDEGLLQSLVEELQSKMEADQLTATEDFKKLDASVLRLLFRRYLKQANDKNAAAIQAKEDEISNLRAQLQSPRISGDDDYYGYNQWS